MRKSQITNYKSQTKSKSFRFKKFIGNWKLPLGPEILGIEGDIGNSRQRRAGFTLIELVVVIAIISIISAIITVNFVEVNKRGRDTTRKSNLQTIKTALEIYRADSNTYPSLLYSIACPTSSNLSSGSTVYMTKIPCDPQKKDLEYDYVASPSGCDGVSTPCTSYTLTACVENDKDKDNNIITPYSQSTCTSQTGYQITNP